MLFQTWIQQHSPDAVAPPSAAACSLTAGSQHASSACTLVRAFRAFDSRDVPRVLEFGLRKDSSPLAPAHSLIPPNGITSNHLGILAGDPSQCHVVFLTIDRAIEVFPPPCTVVVFSASLANVARIPNAEVYGVSMTEGSGVDAHLSHDESELAVASHAQLLPTHAIVLPAA